MECLIKVHVHSGSRIGLVLGLTKGPLLSSLALVYSDRLSGPLVDGPFDGQK